jgi:hypothetical protein
MELGKGRGGMEGDVGGSDYYIIERPPDIIQKLDCCFARIRSNYQGLSLVKLLPRRHSKGCIRITNFKSHLQCCADCGSPLMNSMQMKCTLGGPPNTVCACAPHCCCTVNKELETSTCN